MTRQSDIIFVALLLMSLIFGCQSIKALAPDTQMKDQKLQYLALGDSYTIGEGVAENERYPMQLVDLLSGENIRFEKPTIIATTGWATNELKEGMEGAKGLYEKYDLVTLLIGVNNQYRGRSIENFEEEFEALLDQAIAFAGNNRDHVLVVSIPDWGITPFAEEKGVDKAKVAQEIDQFNSSKARISQSKGVKFTGITGHYRKHGHLPDGVVEDKLHPSGKVYRHWAEKLKDQIVEKNLFR